MAEQPKAQGGQPYQARSTGIRCGLLQTVGHGATTLDLHMRGSIECKHS
jgi:hypothetical protein